jgi:hypothetical protein
MSHGKARRAHGQVLVLVVLGMVGLIAMVAIVIDGGNAWVQQRGTQNGTDAAAEAGAVVLLRKATATNSSWTNAMWDTTVNGAINAAAGSSQNNLTSIAGYYTDFRGNLLTSNGTPALNLADAAKVGAGVVPPNAQGVQAQGSRTFSTYFAGIIGLTHMTTPASATAAAGPLVGVSGTAIMPVTFPVTILTPCTNPNQPPGSTQNVPGTSPWPIIDPNASPSQQIGSNEAIVPLCNTNAGSVGWLDLGSGTLADQISSPVTTMTLPGWFQTQTGDNNSVDTAMNKYDNQIILLPMFDGTCKNKPSGSSLSSCPSSDSGTGNTTWYHVPYLYSFLLSHAYIQGNNNTFSECDGPPGSPATGGNGKFGCLKGWFVSESITGQVGSFVPGTPPGTVMGVQLIK